MKWDAWLLNFGNQNRAVVGWRELLHLIPDASSHTIPQTPKHCSRVLSWQNRIVPIWDMGAWFTTGEVHDSGNTGVLVGYQLQAGAVPQLGALMLLEPPLRITISSEQECPAPSDLSPWRAIASAFLMYEEEPLAVLDLRHMFSGNVHPRKRIRVVC